jgi:hypothetical protein
LHISELTPAEGERQGIFGGTRSGKSSYQDWQIREIQHTRPDAMQILVDSKPRYRAETERGPFRKGRRNAAHRYTSWAKGPILPNSVVVDLWDDKPFANLFKPGEVVILQSGESADWKRMLALLDAFVKANFKGRERRVCVDECLDFTSEIPGELIRKMMSSTGSQEPGENEISDWILAHTRYSGCRRLFSRCSHGSRFFIYGQTLICGIFRASEYPTQNHRRVTIISASIMCNRAEPSRQPSRDILYCQNGIWHNSLKREQVKNAEGNNGEF